MVAEGAAVTIKAVYEDGVLKPKGPLPLKEHAEVEIEIKSAREAAWSEDARSFVGFLDGAPRDVPLARDYEFLLRPGVGERS
jgi:predicted DNA-binding antitoxin AbrB/MazE fold protein